MAMHGLAVEEFANVDMRVSEHTVILCTTVASKKEINVPSQMETLCAQMERNFKFHNLAMVIVLSLWIILKLLFFLTAPQKICNVRR